MALLIAAAAGSMVACSSDNSPSSETLTAADLGAQQIKPIVEYLGAEPYRGADLANGERLAATCRACHTLAPGGAQRIGPNLGGLFGRRAGDLPRFDYSAALRGAEFVWTPRALDAWLAAPYRFLPGNRMSFSGVTDPEDRTDLVAYLLTETSTQ